jgi:acetyl esterase/lipase
MQSATWLQNTRIGLKFISLSILLSLLFPVFGQKADFFQTTYIHPKKPSVNAHLTKGLLRLALIKKKTGDALEIGNKNSKAAKIPYSIRNDKRLKITYSSFENRSLWKIEPAASSTKTVILYFHGGAYVTNILRFQWDMVAAIVRTSNAMVYIADYPLAPQKSCLQVLDYSLKLYQQLLTLHPESTIFLLGDSAGGGLCMSLSNQIHQFQFPKPKGLILFAPWLDVSMSNSEMNAVLKKDPMLNPKGLVGAGLAYSGELDWKHPLVSPINGDLTNHPPLALFVGTHDVLVADCRKLVQQLKSTKNSFNYFEYPGMFHVWMAATKLRESKSVFQQTRDFILKVSK